MSAQHVACPHCGATLKAPPPTFGKTLKCPRCSILIGIPFPQPEPQQVKAPPLALAPIPEPEPERPPLPPVAAAMLGELQMLREEVSELRRERDYDERPRRRRRERDEDYAPPPRPRVQLIEQTGKEWKALQLIGGLGIVVGMGLLCAGFSTGNTNTVPPGAICLLLGLPLMLIGRFGAWWNHG